MERKTGGAYSGRSFYLYTVKGRTLGKGIIDGMTLAEELKAFLHGDVADDDVTLAKYSRDASLFEVRPKVVVYPKDREDVESLVKFVAERKKTDPSISLTARSAGTDMSGGPLSESIVVDFMRYFTQILQIGDRVSVEGGVQMGFGTVEPGVFYRNFEKETLKQGYLFPSYPASRELCAMGGIVNNNSGGEKSLVYGKTQDYVMEMRVVLADGKEHLLKHLTVSDLESKIAAGGFEGELYGKLRDLFEKNYDLAKRAKPQVTKNSAGYNVWDVWDRRTFDITKLLVGAQGTLGLMTEATLALVRTKPCSGMLVIFMDDLKVGGIVNEVLPFEPSSFESFDDHTLRLALKYLGGFVKLLAKNPFSLALAFLPEFWMVLTHGMPKLVLMVEFEEVDQATVDQKLRDLQTKLRAFPVRMRLAKTKDDARKYWAIRRESFNLLRQKVKGMQTAPFVDDLIVAPEHLPEYLPKLYAILDRYGFLYTIAGHMGNGNFHVIPLMHLQDEAERAKIRPAMEEIYALTFQYGGSMTAEHNDGLIRSPFLPQMFGKEVVELFAEVKHIFDPENIFNPGKKVDASLPYALEHMKRS